MFENFNSFAFMNDQLAEDLTVTIPGSDTGKTDDLGRPITDDPIVKQVSEPITNTVNPNMTYSMEEGGQLPVGTLYWLSHLSGCPKGTKVKRTNGSQYEVINHADDIQAGLVYYQIKEVGIDE
ncbi:hypothetical protein YK48G_03990 [Lentilactobacillus fungorum]|uniref:Phage protein n=1 Tax=Lentilactobacillus fungorum TaxID=2201250 RepID=A0ABQ3VXB5_9LACO|nr:hypothetical protein [Lentilactobacillus fungorum]GHP12974.1 hypothetical protein YK48G_03990 [Lentilactobacillus fungorum]